MSFPADFLDAIAKENEKKLTDKETEVFKLLFGQGKTRVQIAMSLGVEPSVISTRLTGIYGKFNIHDGGPVKESRLKDILVERYKRWSASAEPATIAPSSPKLSEPVDPISQRIQEIRSRQCPKLINLYGQIRLPLTHQQVDVQDLYVDVYVLTRLSADYQDNAINILRTYDRKNDRVAMGQRAGDRRDGEETVKQDRYRRSVIVGKPGSGKSTFMQRLVVGCCLGEIFADRIPNLIVLRDIQSAEFNLEQHLQQEWRVDQQTLQEILDSGRVLLLLDGLDEVPEQFQRSVKRSIEQFARDYYQVGIIVTCRTQTVEYNLGNFAFLEVADFNPEQVETFVRKWFTANELASAENQTEKFLTKLEQHPPIRELAITPILLGLTCLVFRDPKDLPARRGELYKRGIELLLTEWDRSREVNRTWGSDYYHNLSLERKQDLLGALALHKFQQEGNFVLFEQSELQTLISSHCDVSKSESASILKTIEECNGLLIRRANAVYSFSHLTFQEYFVAQELTKPDKQALLGSITDKRWREVFHLALSRMEHPDELLLRTKRQIDELLAGDPKLQKFLKWVDGKARSANTPYKPAAVRAFYFALTRDLDFALNLDFDLARDFALTLDSALAFNFDLNFALDQNFTLACKLDFALESDFKLALEHDLTFTRTRDLAIDLDDDFDLNFVQDFASALDRALSLTHDRDYDLYIKLVNLKEILPEYSDNNQENFRIWWELYGNDWILEYEIILREHRNISHNWQFKKSQEYELKQYYDTNKFLVDCLQGECSVSPQVRQEIEETLLLPLSQLGYESHGLN
ncbi:MAG: hypothetical protein B0A82_18605 [Alkalinema sp. CACIAM 70d]|nr:MAG: hypothetical protein B0A82_18605 [Alkalinema sp. CACIAM 70d]